MSNFTMWRGYQVITTEPTGITMNYAFPCALYCRISGSLLVAFISSRPTLAYRKQNLACPLHLTFVWGNYRNGSRFETPLGRMAMSSYPPFITPRYSTLITTPYSIGAPH